MLSVWCESLGRSSLTDGRARADSPGALPGPVWNHVATVLTKPDQQPTPPTKPSAFRTFSSNKLSPFLPTLRSAAAAPQEAPALDSRGGEGPKAENRSDWRRSSWLSPTQTQGLGPCLAKCAAGSRKGGPEPATAPVSLERCVLSGRQPCGQQPGDPRPVPGDASTASVFSTEQWPLGDGAAALTPSQAVTVPPAAHPLIVQREGTGHSRSARRAPRRGTLSRTAGTSRGRASRRTRSRA